MGLDEKDLKMICISVPVVDYWEMKEEIDRLNDSVNRYTISTLTPQTLISGIKGPGGSLLLNLQRDGKKILVIKDLTSILEMRYEARQKIFSQIREIADGYCSKKFGTGKRIEWKGKLGFLCSVTPVIDEHHGHNQILGERFLFCRISNDNPRAIGGEGKENGQERGPN